MLFFDIKDLKDFAQFNGHIFAFIHSVHPDQPISLNLPFIHIHKPLQLFLNRTVNPAVQFLILNSGRHQFFFHIQIRKNSLFVPFALVFVFDLSSVVL
jgi:hypothetical protein